MLLITPGTGGTGINIIEASVVIQIESWWNHNVEKQLYGRFHRQGQVFRVKVFRLVATNAMVDKMVMLKQQTKDHHNKKILAHVSLNDTDEVAIPSI